MRPWIRKLVYVVVLFFLVVQLFPPTRTNPSTDPARTIHASFSIEPAVTSVIARACNDCHSNLTVWPWYSRVAPISWLVAGDVKRGRKALNFSDWQSLNPEKQQEILPEICKEAADRDMPTEEYILMHPHAKLTSTEVQSICTWAHSEALHRLHMADNN